MGAPKVPKAPKPDPVQEEVSDVGQQTASSMLTNRKGRKWSLLSRMTGGGFGGKIG